MKMYRVFIEEREHLVGKIEMEYLVLVFGEKARVEIIELTDQNSSDNIVDDENSFKCTHGQSSQEGSL